MLQRVRRALSGPFRPKPPAEPGVAPAPEAVAKLLQVRRKARQAGVEDKPARTDTELDGPQTEIRNYYQERTSALSHQTKLAVTANLHQIQNLETELDRFSTEAILDLRPTVTNEVNKLKELRYADLVSLRQQERRLLRELNFFRAENDLARNPHYPDSLILHWAVIVAIIVGESVLNSYFFGKASDFGLIGGWAQAIIIALVNVGVAYLVGAYAAPNVNHVRVTRRVLGGLATVVGVLFLVFFNGATAHYRALLEVNPDQALSLALPSFYEHWFRLDNFDALVLLIIGLLVAAFSAIKVFRAEDRYPGYGALDRRHRETLDAYREAYNELKTAIYGIVTEAIRQIDERVGHLEGIVKEYSSLLHESVRTISDYNVRFERLENDCNQVLYTYRTENERIRTSDAPGYFTTSVAFERDESVEAYDFQTYRRKLDTYNERLTEVKTAALKLKNDIGELCDEQMKVVNHYLESLEKTADRLLEEEDAAVAAARRPAETSPAASA